MFSNHIMYIVVAAIVMIGIVLRARYRSMEAAERRHLGVPGDEVREELQRLKQRLAVLERIAVEKDGSLMREIEDLRKD